VRTYSHGPKLEDEEAAMCGSCEVTETGICFCGTSVDPNPDPESRPCGVKGDSAYCDRCGHQAGMMPMEYDQDVTEY
jgi:hypothetical protein